MAFLDYDGLQYFYSKMLAKTKTLIPTKTSQLTNDSSYLTTSGTAAKATADASGNVISSTYHKKASGSLVVTSSTAPSDTTALWVVP